jgi:hypothetical protein
MATMAVFWHNWLNIRHCSSASTRPTDYNLRRAPELNRIQGRHGGATFEQELSK